MVDNNSKEKVVNNKTIVAMMSAAGFDNRITDLTMISTGMLNIIYKIKMININNPLILRIRIFQHSEYGQEFAAERFAYYLINQAKVNTPKLHYFCLHPEIYGYQFAVFDYIEGQMLDTVLSSSKTSQKKKFVLLESVAHSLKEVHKVKGAGFGTLTSIWFSSSQRREFWSTLFYAEHARLLEINHNLGDLYCKSIERWLDCFMNLPPYLGDARLIHGDIHGRNIIAMNNNQISLIDWEASRFRIIPYDFAQIRFLNLKNDSKCWDAFIDSYINACEEDINKKQFIAAIDICQSFWRLRMGLFQLQFPFTQNNYFGYAKDHISQLEGFIKKDSGLQVY